MSSHESPPDPAREELVPVPDLAGTPAADAEGQFFGEVYGALAQAETGLIRYLDLDVHGTGRHVLVPIGHVRVARPGEPSAGVRLRAATVGDLTSIPAYEPHPGTGADEQERAILSAHGRLFSGRKYYAHPAYDHSGLYAGGHPILRGPASPAGAELLRLSELPEHEVAEEEQDVRSWPVVSRDGVVVGEVADLVADPAALRIRYALVRLADGGAGREPDCVLLPVGYLELDVAAGRVRTPALGAADVRALPPQHGPIRRADEDAVRAALDRVLDGARRFERADFRARPGRRAQIREG